MKHKKRSGGRKFLKLISIVLCFWVFSVIIFRFIAPPLTPLMLIRSAQQVLVGKPSSFKNDWVTLKSLPPFVLRAVVTAEDARFMEHHGLDMIEMSSAWSKKSLSRPRGASTITMQTVKNVFLWPGRSYLRKALEIPMSVVADFIWGKRRTLELYLNVIEWGEGIYGIEAASQNYYGKPAAKLTEQQAASLASILPNPRVISLKQLNGGARVRLRRILREMDRVKVPRV